MTFCQNHIICEDLIFCFSHNIPCKTCSQMSFHLIFILRWKIKWENIDGDKSLTTKKKSEKLFQENESEPQTTSAQTCVHAISIPCVFCPQMRGRHSKRTTACVSQSHSLSLLAKGNKTELMFLIASIIAINEWGFWMNAYHRMKATHTLPFQKV